MCFVTKLLKKLFGKEMEIDGESDSSSSSSSSSNSSNSTCSSSSSSRTSFSSQPITIPTGKKRALQWGINDYPSSNNDLRGCLNDIAEWSFLLKDVYKFDEIYTIFDSNATKNNVVNKMKELIEKSVAGDILVFDYSGHGTYTQDLNGDEIDGKDEAICLYDGLLIDDDIKEILSKIKDGVRTTVIFDSCFSGSSTRAFGDNNDLYRVARFMPPKDEMIAKMSTLPVKSKMFKTIGQTEEEMNHILISGCSDNEVSYDANFSGKYYGAMSYWATKVLKGNPFITYSEFYTKLRTKLPSRQYPQSPQLEGSEINKNRIMFS